MLESLKAFKIDCVDFLKFIAQIEELMINEVVLEFVHVYIQC
jgi:hypothetical protein